MTIAVLLDDGGPVFLVRRSRRALAAASIEARVARTRGELAAAVSEGARFVVRAGAFVRGGPPPLPASATGLPLVAFGAPLSAPAPSCGEAALVREARAWLHDTGGAHSGAAPFPFATLVLDEAMAARVARGSGAGSAFAHLRETIAREHARIVRVAALDAPFAEELRVAEIVTSAQIGGAERVASDLARSLPKAGVSARLFALGSPTRARLAAVEGALDWSGSRLDVGGRIEALVDALDDWGADVAHAHLFGPDVLEALRDAGHRPLVTIHNARPGFPAGTAGLGPNDASLVVGCADAVERDLVASGVSAPVRTIKNGITPFEAPSRERVEAWRRSMGLTRGVVALLVVANPRPQKRLERVAPIARALAALLSREVAVVWAGEASARDDVALALARDFGASLDEQGIRLVRLGAELELGLAYGACDAMLVTSAWEGLSLAQLEALALGLPVVATDVGGTREIASACSGLRLVDPEAPVAEVAEVLREALAARPDAALPDRFSTRAMVRGYARLARRAASLSTAEGRDLVLVTNNFSPGGAQSSARRLLVELARRGRRVLAVTIEEDDALPTPGLVALRSQGIETLALLRGEASGVVERLLDEVDREGARAVVAWNAIAEHKLLLADSLLRTRYFDVSPGEMYFTSLARHLERPRSDVSIESARAYGHRLAGVIVKFEAERALAEHTLGAPVFVIPNGVPLRARPLRASRRAFRFGTAVRVHPHKRLDRLLDAFEALLGEGLDVELAIAGAADAGCDAHLAELVDRTRGLPVTWLGHRDDVGGFLDELDAFVLVAEPAGCPNASLEAMAAGLPTIATDVGGIREQLDGGAGLVAPRDDPSAMAGLMRRVALEAPLREELSRRAIERIEARFSLARMADAYERVLFGRATRPA